MTQRSVIKKNLSLILYFGIFIGLILFLIQQLLVSKEYKKLEIENKKLIQKNVLYKDDITKIIYTNINPNCIQTDVEFSSNKIYLCVDYPVCTSCFEDVIHLLQTHSKKNEKEVILLCGTKYIKEIKKVLKFENLGQIEVEALIDFDKSDTKMIVVFKSTENKQFYLPLPENREVKFLETFLNNKED